MPRTIDGILAAHHAATERRGADQPVWDRTLDVSDLFHNIDLPQAERYARIADRIKRCPWFTSRNPDDIEFEETVEGLAAAAGPEEFNDYWDDLYDRANTDRVWIKTR